MILLLDNYDSFTYNLAQYLEEAGANVRVVRNDRITVGEVLETAPAGIMISPGPCTPDLAGISEDLIKAAAGSIPIFGVCLGMQAIGEVFGARVTHAKRILHGKRSSIVHTGQGVFEALPSPLSVIRYHSLAITDLPAELEITATAEDGELMGVRHRRLDVEGVQFHPESILSEGGKEMIQTWLKRTLIK